MTREVTVQDRAKQIFKTWLTPFLSEKGFKKDGRIYSRQIGRIQHLLDIHQSTYNRRDKIDFSINVGVYVPDVLEEHYGKWPEEQKRKKIDSPRGVIHCAPGLITTPKRAQGWILQSTDGPNRDVEVGQDIRAVVEEGAFRRFFDRFQSEADVAAFLEQPRKKEDQQMFPYAEAMCLVFAGIIWDQLGQCERCQECMTKAAEAAKGKRLQANTESFARDYVCGNIKGTHAR